MTVKANINVGFAGPSEGLQLAYVKEDNLLPSEIAAQEQTASNVAAGCTVPVLAAAYKSEAETEADKELLFHQDQLAWPIRKLRLYPPVNAMLRCSYGDIIAQHVVSEDVDEILVLSGTDSGNLEYSGESVSLSVIGRAYDENGDQVFNPQLEYRGAGTITSDRKLWAQVRATYRTTYRVLQLTVVPTAEDFDVQVIAYYEGETASVVVPFELLEYDTGQVAGLNCGGNTSSPEPTPVPAPVARYQMISFEHPPEVELGKSVTATMIFRNINGVDGSLTARFQLQYSSDSASGVFQCAANSVVECKLSLTPTAKGYFTTIGGVLNDVFSQKFGSLKVVDPKEVEPVKWIEEAREMSDIDVNGVLIKRIETVTFHRDDDSGAKQQLVFDNSDVQ